MKAKLRYTIFFSVMSSLCLSACKPQSSQQWEVLQKEIQKAKSINDIQNLMARRAMYHSIGHNELEFELWSKRDDIRWAQNQGCWIGRETIKTYYVDVNYQMQAAQLKLMSESNPAIDNDLKTNRYIGNNVWHLLTTPIIEVADDGESAKAFWYTPGVILASTDGLTAQGMHMWEKYFVDLIKEDGEWRFLHIQVATDWAAPLGQGLPQSNSNIAAVGSEGGAQQMGPGPGAEGLVIPPPTISKVLYSEYSPTRRQHLTPRLPEPYSTFSDTFEYADCR
ncbi:hypothetical protein FJ444_04475 [Aestuariibacter sp. GS-14]|uniref:nuclear transport factor 2 family protein n=1 Tax=Aestuariibacter sp. GS-14 TaxID=2590670 RepID=UPI00112E0DB9|nr:nuclear transport factor 2 family protein [Aestuariibacter sp. GS-14]TPV60882.1 hypothetical protein FJ444_04475 [Aestuariibacter sp. GS-14]